jgi:hypothetical protein
MFPRAVTEATCWGWNVIYPYAERMLREFDYNRGETAWAIDARVRGEVRKTLQEEFDRPGNRAGSRQDGSAGYARDRGLRLTRLERYHDRHVGRRASRRAGPVSYAKRHRERHTRRRQHGLI